MRDSASASIKTELRRQALALRDGLPAAERAQAAVTIAGRPFPVAVAPGTIVAGFMPMKSEINPLPLMRKLADAGARLALPVVDGRGKPLIMRAWGVGEPLAAGVWGIREPPPAAPAVAPDILIVPLLAFDRAGTASATGRLTTYDHRGLRAMHRGDRGGVRAQEIAVFANPHDEPPISC